MMHNGAMNGILFCQASEYGAEKPHFISLQSGNEFHHL